MGFGYYYGFLGGDTDEFNPTLYENTLPTARPANDPGYFLDRDLADHVINWIQQQKAVAPDRPFFAYLAPGAAHSPHSAPQEWLLKFRGKFDMGWDEMRKQSFERQKALGIIPKDAELTPRPSFLPAWDSLDKDHKKLYSRMMEAYAAALACDDNQIGRIVANLKQTGEFDKTLIIFIQGDNGSSAEGGLQGLHTEESMINGYPEDFKWLLAHIDEIGGPKAHNHFPAAWAWAMNTPFQYYKQVASHLGGIRNGLVVSWPGHISQPQTVRQQFLHVSDVAPTILEAAGLSEPKVIAGVTQMPVDGISFAYTFSDPAAAPRRTEQVFEMMSNASLYKDGWVAATTPVAAPWLITTRSVDIPFSTRHWELYHLDRDYSEAHDLAASNPAKLEEMKQEFLTRAAASHILPIHGVYDGAGGKPSVIGDRTEFVYHGPVSRIPENSAPRTAGRSFTITASVEIPETEANGAIVAEGGRFGGYALYLRNGLPSFHYNMTDERQYRIASGSRITPGTHVISAEFVIDKPQPGSPGTLTLKVDGNIVGTGRIANTYRTWFSNTEGFDVGEDAITPVTEDYASADTHFTGKINEVRFLLK